MIERKFPADSARLSITLFSTDVTIVQPLIYATAEEHADVLRSLVQPMQTTNTAAAFEKTWYDVWEEDVRNGVERDRIVILLTDGQPSQDQDPYSVWERFYFPNDIEVVSICMGDSTNMNYVEEISNAYQPIFFGSLADAESSFEDAFDSFMQDCNYGER